MEIYENTKNNFYEVWLTNEEQETVDRNKLCKRLLSKKLKKYKVVFFLSGNDDLFKNTESLLLNNLGCA